LVNSIVSQKEHDLTSYPTIPTGSGASTPAPIQQGLSSTSASSTALSPFKMGLMSRLDIPLALADRTDGSLHLGYQKYRAFLQASETLTRMCANGQWEGKKPTVTDLIEIFQSKSMWHAHHAKAFYRVSDYPEMVLWLQKDKDAPSNGSLWGYDKAVYNFKDLFDYLDSKGQMGKRGKGKVKAKNESASGSGSKKKKVDKKKK
jgi:hypothetical protein